MSALPAADAGSETSGGNPRAGRLGVLVFAALVVASFAAFFFAQRLKHIPTAVQQLRFDSAFYPAGGGRPVREPISFEIERRDRVTVKILDAQGADVATLVKGHPLGAYTQYSLSWNGRRGMGASASRPAGTPAPNGEYRIAVMLQRRKVEVRSPSVVKLIRRGR